MENQDVPNAMEEGNRVVIWNRGYTLKLLEQYKIYREKVGTMEVKNFKKLWELISMQLKNKYNITAAPSNCENRWRVLERNYKKLIDNNKQTGAGRKYFEYEEEMKDILGKKKNINPTVLLATDTIVSVANIEEMVEVSEGPPSETQNEGHSLQPKPAKRRILTPKTFKKDILESIRQDKIARHKEKMRFEKEKFEKLYQLEMDKHATKIEKNNILKERNALMKEAIKRKVDNV